MYKDYNIAWEVTENCNHNCFYCYNYWRGDSPAQPCLEKELDYSAITEKIISLTPLSVALTGGEPLLVFDKIKDSIRSFSKNGIFIRLLTNGSLITDEMASFFAQYQVQLMVSFPSSNQDIYTAITKKSDYCDVVRGLDILKEYGNDVLINIVVNSVNLNQMEETAQFLLNRYGYKTLYFSRATKPQNADVHLQDNLLDNRQMQVFFNKCLRIKEKYKIKIRTCGGCAYCAVENPKALSIFAKGCGGGGNSFVVSSSGNVRVCGKDSQVFGNIFLKDIDKIMEKASFWTDDSAIPKECTMCKFKHRCRGGCHMSSYDAVPKYNSLDANAMPYNIPVLERSKKSVSIKLCKKYILSHRTNYHCIDGKNRFSCMFLCAYVSDSLSNALRNGGYISLIKLIRLTGYPYCKAKRLMAELIRKKIIVEG